MIIDCDTCAVRGDACGDCVVGVLLGVPDPATRPDTLPSGAPVVQLDAREQRALAVLADQGLVPRLRLVATRPPEPAPEDRSRHAG
ncbi:hypothetical protein [Pseudonocardia dioxanivorans]|jgi:hypothetical protein|uniref:hypothetical protein n=1 Tax=Pseudonocardia dioxanivorans TaxID=240495 RepID=UPI000CD0BBA1|nr:hypothetical protein [Pseudonocardia dioxanivorans]